MGMHELGDVGTKALTLRTSRRRSVKDRAAGDLRLARPLRFSAFDRVDRGAMKSESRVPAQIGTLASVGHRTEDQFTALKPGLDPRDPRRTIGSQGGDRLVSMGVEQCT